MKRGVSLFFIAFLVFGILANISFVMADDNDSGSNSGSDSGRDDSVSNTNTGDTGDEDEVRIDIGEEEEDEEVEIEAEDHDDEEEVEVEVERDGRRVRVKIHAEGIDAIRIREAIRDRNRLRLNGTELPENCTRTGSVIRCELEGRKETRSEISADISLPSEIRATIGQLEASLNETPEEIEISIKIKKDGEEVEAESEVKGGQLTGTQETLLNTLMDQLASLVENSDREKIEIEIQVKHRFRERRVMVVEAGESGNIIVKVKDHEFKTKIELYHHDGRLFGIGEDNETRAIDFLPDEIRDRIRDRIRARLDDNESIELDESGEYRVEVRKHARFLGVFRVKERVRFHVDPETGDVLNERAPWWGFLAKDIEEE